METDYSINFDGSCKKNPGPIAGYGYVIKKNGFDFKSHSEMLPANQIYSNNYSELYAIYKALEFINKQGDATSVFVRGDSKLAINLMKKRYRCKNPDKIYYNAYVLAVEQLNLLRSNNTIVMFDWIPRELNSEADKLSR